MALEAGVSALDFWHMTPAETYASIEALEKRTHKWALYEAWHVAALQRMKKMPSLKRILRTDDDMPDIEQLKQDHEELMKLAAASKAKKDEHGG